MPSSRTFDLSTMDSWCGLRPGMNRTQVLETLRQQGVESQEYGSDNLTASTDSWEMELHFATDGSQRLRQLSIEGEDIVWGTRPLLGVRMDEALRTLGSPTTAVWQANDVSSDPFPESAGAPATPITDEELLEEGTIWLLERGLGLVIYEVEVTAIAWRDRLDLPTQFASPVTEAQRQLAARSDLEDHLRSKRAERTHVEQKKSPLSWLQTIVTLVTIGSLAFVAKKGVEETQRWNQAPTLNAKLVAIENGPMKPFREFVPPALRWLFPRQKAVIVEAYRVEFTAPREELPQQAVLERGELYVPPQQAGDEVPIAYLAGDPPRVKGLSRARDAAFVEYMPWAIAIGVAWLAAQFLLSLLPAALRLIPRLVRRFAPTGVVKDFDRPELR